MSHVTPALSSGCGSTLLAYGFRPFFLLAAGYAVFVLPAWMVALHGFELPAAPLSPIAWHAHEMVYGFVLAAVAGFVLTAVPGWTGRSAISGAPLLCLVVLWAAGRAAMTLPLGLPAVLAAGIDLAFPIALLLVVTPVIVRTSNRRNYVVVAFIAMLIAANGWFHWRWLHGEPTTPAIRMAVSTLLLMVTVIGGRIVPAFTASWLRRRGQYVVIRSRPWLDGVAVVATAGVLIVDLVTGNAVVRATIAAIAAVALVVRLGCWHGHRTFEEPILWVLHLAYAWLPVALALKAAAALGAGLPGASWNHALTAGAFSTMILAVMSRAALGHTGRPIVACRRVAAAYVGVTAAALLRVFGPVVSAPAWTLWFVAAGILYTAAFAIFLSVNAPILCAPRVDGRAG